MTSDREKLEPLQLLVAEDAEDDYLLLLQELERGGLRPLSVRVQAAGPFRQALQQSWDMIISDHHMGSFDGFQALAIRNELAPEKPFIIVSGTIGEEVAVEAMRRGASDYLMKGNLTRLVPAIRRELAETRQRQAHRRAEIELAVTQERFRLVAKAASDAIYDWDVFNDRVWFSESIKTLFGHDVEDISPAWQWWLGLVHPEDRAAVEKNMAASLQERRESWSLEYRLRRGDGVWATVMDRGHFVYDQDDRPFRRVGALIDISEQRRLERQFQQAQKMEVLGRLAGGIAHDFNNLLAVIVGYSELAMDKVGGQGPDSEYLREVIGASERAKNLVKQLMTFSRITPFEMKKLDLNMIVKHATSLLERTISKMITIETNLASDLRPVNGDPNELEQALLNLATNAQDAMPQGGRLVLETTNETIHEKYGQANLKVAPGEYVLLQVSDTGQGMDEHTREKIFEPFFTTKELGKGTGLGLSTVYGMVKSHGGLISCYSEPGQGTTFKIYLPVFQETDAIQPQEAPAGKQPAGGHESILLVDDVKALSTLGEVILVRAGYKVIKAQSGEEALDLYRQHGAGLDLVVMDLGMPGMGGHKCLQEILAMNPLAKVMIASGYSPQAQVKNSLQAGAVGYVAKPYRKTDLLAKVREVLDKTN